MDTPDLPGFSLPKLVAPFKFKATPHEYKIIALRECAIASDLCDTPLCAANYWRNAVVANPNFTPELENLVVLLLNTRRRLKGHQIVCQGTHDTMLCHPMPTFRLAVMTMAPAIILMHNHPSGEATPSEADIKITRDLIRAGQLLKIEVLDHVIIGQGAHVSLRELGYFYS
jgi:DNA repair protein RadC